MLGGGILDDCIPGGLPCERGGDARRKNVNQIPKVDQSGHGSSLFDP